MSLFLIYQLDNNANSKWYYPDIPRAYVITLGSIFSVLDRVARFRSIQREMIQDTKNTDMNTLSGYIRMVVGIYAFIIQPIYLSFFSLTDSARERNKWELRCFNAIEQLSVSLNYPDEVSMSTFFLLLKKQGMSKLCHLKQNN